MCDYDYSYEHIYDKMVKTRVEHECASCMRNYPAGTIMRRSCGKTEGEFGHCYACQACIFALGQEDHSPMHLCWGWNWDGSDYPDGDALLDYINECIKAGKTPLVAEWEKRLADIHDREAMEE